MEKTIGFYLAFLSALLITGCMETEQLETPGLTLLSEEVNAGPEGGMFAVQFKLHGAEYSQLRAICDADWIGQFSFSADGSASFNVNPTENRDKRHTTVIITVPGFGMTDSLDIVQSGGKIEDLTTEILEITPNRVYYNVTPYDKEMTYIVMLRDKSTIDQYTSNQEIYEADMADMEALAPYYGLSSGKDMLNMYYLRKGNTRIEHYLSLSPDTEYCLYCYGITEDCEMTTEIFKSSFTTLENEIIDPAITITPSVNGHKVSVSIEPKSEDIYYVYEMLDKTLFNDPADIMNFWQGVFDEQILKWESNTWMNTEEAVQQIATKGSIVADYSIEPNSDFVMYVLSISKYGLVNSDIIYEEIHTGDVARSDNIITISTTEIYSNRAMAEFKTTTADKYCYVNIPASDIEDLTTDEEILEKLTTSGYRLSMNNRGGDTKGSFFNLTPDTDYVIFAFGYEYETVTTDLFRCEYRTSAQ